MAALLSRSSLIITDSGGLQEEGAALGVPVAVVREVTERPEGVDSGIITLVGTEEKKLYLRLKGLLSDKIKLKQMATSPNPYGDGRASGRIAQVMAWRFGIGERPADWNSD